MSKIKSVFHKLWVVLSSKEARGPELALARLVFAGLGVKLGINLVDYIK